MTKSTFLLLLLVLIPKISTGQIAADKYADRISEANEYLLSEEYKEALTILNDLRLSGFENANLDFKTGYCYLFMVTEKEKALPLLKKATLQISKSYIEDDPLEEKAPVEAMLFLGDAYRNNNKFREAMKCYNQYAEIAGTEDVKAKEIALKRIKECQIARLLQSKPVGVVWEHLDNTINEGIANLHPVVSADGNILVFTRKMKFYDAIYYTRFTGQSWEEPLNITTQLGSDGEFYPTSFSPDGKKLLFSSYEMLSGQDIYESVWNGSRWSKLKKLDEGVNSKFVEINASYSPDGNTIFFASNRDNGYGGFDIYQSTRRADNSWSQAINLGPEVNTRANEKSPRLLNQGNQLAFSSEGHLNMGGYDIFYIDYPIKSNSKPKNLGYPLNTVNDDLSFYPVLDQNAGYVSRYDDQSQGETDIYKAAYTSLSNFQEVQVNTMLDVSGISGSDTIYLFLVDNIVKDTIDQKAKPATSGSSEYSLYPGNFTLLAQNKDNETEISSFSVPENTQDILQIPLSITFKTKSTASAPDTTESTESIQTLKIRNITFAFNKYQVDTNFYSMLNEIALFLKESSSVTITISGYTDVIGNSTYNQALSRKRAFQVMNLLQKYGIQPERMKVIGAGSTHFLAKNSNSDGTDNPIGRSFNRRVEIQFENAPSNVIIVKENKVPPDLKF